jgi:CubicO group peptidase (beta-lactamase class C family)
MQVTLANWRTAPFNRWAFHHVRELIPSADIAHDTTGVRPLRAHETDLKNLRIDPDAGEAMDLDAFLSATDTDGIAILQRGRLIFERYANGMSDETPHILMSVSKSMLGLLAHEIGLDAGARAAELLPELKGTAYEGATIRHLLDMRAGIVWDENYLATSGPIVEYRKATGWNPGDGSGDLKSFYRQLTQSFAHGGPVHYVSPNSDLLGWLIERATGRRYADLMSEYVWKKIGAERSAYITVDRLGAPRCAGGMCATLRDLARVGQWMIEERAGFLDGLMAGDAQAWARGDLLQVFRGLPLRYRSHWYVLDGEAPLFFGWGIHGQFLFVDRINQLVIAKLSSEALPVDVARIGLTLRAASQLRQLLA